MGSRKYELRHDEYDPRKRNKRVLGWVIVSICAFVLIAGTVYLLLDNAQQSDAEKMYQQLSTNAIVNLQASDMPEIGYTSDTASMQDALRLMNGASELTEEEQKTLETEAVERNADSDGADLLVSQQLVTQNAVDSVSTVPQTSRMDFSNLLK